MRIGEQIMIVCINNGYLVVSQPPLALRQGNEQVQQAPIQEYAPNFEGIVELLEEKIN